MRYFREQYMTPLTLICSLTVMLCGLAVELRANASEGVSPQVANGACSPGADSDSRAASRSDQEAELKRLLVDRWQTLRQAVAVIQSADDPTPEMQSNLVESEVRLLNAELDICELLGQSITADKAETAVLRPCDKADQRIALHERIAETRLDRWRRVRALSETGRRGGEASIEAQARTAYWDAKIAVFQECIKAQKPVPRRTSSGIYPPTVSGDWKVFRRILPTDMAVELYRLWYHRHIALLEELAAVRATEDPTFRMSELESEIPMKLYRSKLEVCDALGFGFLGGGIELGPLEACDKRVERVAIRERMLEHRQDVCARIAALAAPGPPG